MRFPTVVNRMGIYNETNIFLNYNIILYSPLLCEEQGSYAWLDQVLINA